MRQTSLFLLLALGIGACRTAGPPAIETVVLPSESPLVAIRLLFKAGSIYDPPGKEGLAALTGLMLAKAGTEARSYRDLVEALYPMAASIDVVTDREVTVISAEVYRDSLETFTDLLLEAVLHPGFEEADFNRNREQLLAYLTTTLRAANDELLGLEALQLAVFRDHPYGHAPEGTVEGLQSLTLDDVRSFYARHYCQSCLLLGVAGGYPEGWVDSLEQRLTALPVGTDPLDELPPAPPIQGRQVTVIDKTTDSVGIHFGYPLPITRADSDYYPLMVANSFLGEHRTFHGRLMQQLRGKRGLNYGDYSYIEYWWKPPFTSRPSPNVPRRQQYFSVWVRPVVPNTAHFAFRAAVHEVERLIREGMTQEEFELTRKFLANYSKLWAQTLSDRLGFLMDSRYYGMPSYIDEIDRRLAELTLDEVNASIRRYLQTENFEAVVVADDAAGVRAYLEADAPSPMHYNSQPEPEVLEADKEIEGLALAPDSVTVIPVDEMFERATGG